MPPALYYPFPRPRLLAAVLAATLCATACAEPPSKELHQAQGAIDAARAAGAEQYAATELQAAIAALAQADAAVTAGDYRQALSLALDSRERAQEAAGAAVDASAKARGDAERELAEAAALLQRLEARLAEPAVARLPRRVVTPAQAAVTTATTSLQEARAALDKEEYEQVGRAAEAVAEQLQAALEALDRTVAEAGRGRRR